MRGVDKTTRFWNDPALCMLAAAWALIQGSAGAIWGLRVPRGR